MSGEVDFLHADKHECFLQIGTMTLYEDGQTFFQKFPIASSLLMGMIKHS